MQDHLVHEERVPTRLLGDRCHELGWDVLERQTRQQLPDRNRVEPRQGDPPNTWVTPPRGKYIGQRMTAIEVDLAVGDHHQQGKLGGPPHQVPDPAHRGFVSPVSIIDHHDQRSSPSDSDGELGEGIHHPIPFRFRRHRRRFIDLAAERISKGRRDTRHQRRTHTELADEHVTGGDPEVFVEHLRHRPVRLALTFVGGTPPHQRARCPQGRCEFIQQPGLANSRFTGDQHRAARARSSALPRIGQHTQLQRATHPRCRRLCRRGLDRRPADLARRHRLVQSFEHQFTDRAEVGASAAPGQHADDLRGQDLSRRRRCFQPGRFHHRQTEAVAVLPRHIPCTDPHADGQLQATTSTHCLHCPLHRYRCLHRIGRRLERRQDPVASTLHHSTPVRHDRIGQGRVVFATQLVCHLLPQPRAQRR